VRLSPRSEERATQSQNRYGTGGAYLPRAAKPARYGTSAEGFASTDTQLAKKKRYKKPVKFSIEKFN